VRGVEWVVAKRLAERETALEAEERIDWFLRRDEVRTERRAERRREPKHDRRKRRRFLRFVFEMDTTTSGKRFHWPLGVPHGGTERDLEGHTRCSGWLTTEGWVA
jgi:hypothetical protein